MADTTVAPTNDLVRFRGKGNIMSRLSAADRKDLKKSDFAGPDDSYPDEDKTHADNAKARASEMLKRGDLTQAEHDKIVARANAKLRSMGIKEPSAGKGEKGENEKTEKVSAKNTAKEEAAEESKEKPKGKKAA